jgi:taurine dioxygenase
MSADLSLLSDEELLEKTGTEVVPITKDVGAEVLGVDLSIKLDKPTFELIHRAWLEYGVLVFRKQEIDSNAFIAFSARFGDLDNAPVMENGRAFVDGYPELFVISNVLDNGLRIGSLGARELEWHTDMAYAGEPPMASCLYAVEVPDGEGKTGFLNMYKAYSKLPVALKEHIKDKAIKHDSVYTLDGYLREGGGRTLEHVKALGCFDVEKLPGAWHPAVRTHPETGREALYIGRRQNTFVEGLNLQESEELLNMVWKYVNRIGKKTFHHEWEKGDVVIWDNRCIMHRRDAFPASTRRVMHRTQMQGSRPF